jgi:PHD/YefM family antitoxin component YafN of YafNO toxin-antitoxin module
MRQVLERVRTQRETVVVRSYDTPQAVIIPYDDYQDFKKWQIHREQRAAWPAELRDIAEHVSARAALSEENAAALITEAIQETRKSATRGSGHQPVG